MSDTGNEFSLIACMQEVPDPRAPYNQKHKFLDIIMIAVTAILCGMDTWNEIEDWANSKREWLGSFLELPGGIPSHDTINRVFQMMDPEKFHDAFFRLDRHPTYMTSACYIVGRKKEKPSSGYPIFQSENLPIHLHIFLRFGIIQTILLLHSSCCGLICNAKFLICCD